MLAELREQFLGEFTEETRARIRTAVSMIPPAGAGGDEAAKSIADMMHTIAGEAMLIGLAEIALLARAAGGAARRYLETRNDLGLVVCARALRSLSRAIEQLAASQSPSEPNPITIESRPLPDRIRVMVVDDSLLNTALLSEGLDREGFSTITANDNLELIIARMENFQPQILLLDLIMPGCDTRELCQRIHSTPRLSKARIVLITSLPEAEAAGFARSLGALCALSKESGIQAIVQGVRELTESK